VCEVSQKNSGQGETRHYSIESHLSEEASAKAWAWCECYSPLGELWLKGMKC